MYYILLYGVVDFSDFWEDFSVLKRTVHFCFTTTWAEGRKSARTTYKIGNEIYSCETNALYNGAISAQFTRHV